MAFAMGSWCRDLQPAGVINAIPGNHFELADQTATTATQTLVSRAKFLRAVIYCKNMASTGSCSFFLQAGTTTAWGTGAINIDSRSIGGSSGSYTFILEGFYPDAATTGALAARVQVIPVAGWTFDCIIDGL